MKTLRPYQLEAAAAVLDSLKQGVYRQLLCLSTGSGKTPLVAALVGMLKDVLPGQTLFLAHRKELIEQGADKLKAWNPSLKIQIDMGQEYADPDCDVIVSSVATLGRKAGKRATRFNWPNITKCIVDEAHLSVAQSYHNVFEQGSFLSGSKLLLGVTATPTRGDGKALSTVYDKISYTYSLRTAIEQGWLVDVRGIKVCTDVSLDKVKTLAGEFDAGQLQDAVNTPERNLLAVKAWLDNAEGRQTIAFTAGIEHAKDMAKMFRQHGIVAEPIWGADPDRVDKIKRLRSGEIRVMCNSQLLAEGFDLWTIGCVLLAKPTKSSVFYSQSIGRSTRLQEGTGNLLEALAAGISPLKRDALIIDVLDTCSRHSLITLPTLLGMAPGLDLKGKSLVKSLVKLEEAFKKTPYADFSKLTDIDKLETFVESIDLFTVRVPEEVLNNSLLSWNRSADGGFLLMLPNKDFIAIKQNLLDIWQISAKITNNTYRGERGSLAEAFKAADKLVTDKVPECLKLLKREGQDWHKDKPTEGQLKLLTKFFRGQPLPTDLTKGRASSLIGQFLSGKKRKVTA